MTLVVAWVHLGAAFIAGDSAVTHPGPPASERSTFDELQLAGGRAVEEMTPKVFRLSRDVLAAFSGSVSRAEGFLGLIVRALAAGERLVAVLADGSPPADPAAPEFTVVFALVENGAARLLRYSSVDGIARDPGDMCILGSAPAALADEVRRRIQSMRTVGHISDDMVLAGALADLQALSVHEVLPEKRIGGAFFGAGLRPEVGTFWQPPITYVLHPPGAFNVDAFRAFKTRGPERSVALIHARVHHEAGIVFSSVLDDTLRILPSPWTGKRTRAEWMEALRQLYAGGSVWIPDDSTSHFTFIDTIRPQAVVLKRRPWSTIPIQVADGKLLLSNLLVERINLPSSGEFDLRLVVQPDATASEANQLR